MALSWVFPEHLMSYVNENDDADGAMVTMPLVEVVGVTVTLVVLVITQVVAPNKHEVSLAPMLYWRDGLFTVTVSSTAVAVSQ